MVDFILNAWKKKSRERIIVFQIYLVYVCMCVYVHLQVYNSNLFQSVSFYLHVLIFRTDCLLLNNQFTCFFLGNMFCLLLAVFLVACICLCWSLEGFFFSVLSSLLISLFFKSWLGSHVCEFISASGSQLCVPQKGH